VETADYFHGKNVTHRDLKLENILIDAKKTVRIIDFGFSTCFPNSKKLKMCCGTPSYMAPEIVERIEFFGPPVDIWALGVILYALLSGTFPFRASSDRELYSKIIRGRPSFPDSVSIPAMQLIKRMLSLDPAQRPSAWEVLNDPWFSHSSFNPVATLPCSTKPARIESFGEVKTAPSSDGGSMDNDIINDIVNLGYERDDVAMAVRHDSGHIARLYRKLVRDRKV
jgi:serine/threonine protein kinase